MGQEQTTCRREGVVLSRRTTALVLIIISVVETTVFGVRFGIAFTQETDSSGFQTPVELIDAVDAYLADSSEGTDLAKIYGIQLEHGMSVASPILSGYLMLEGARTHACSMRTFLDGIQSIPPALRKCFVVLRISTILLVNGQLHLLRKWLACFMGHLPSTSHWGDGMSVKLVT